MSSRTLLGVEALAMSSVNSSSYQRCLRTAAETNRTYMTARIRMNDTNGSEPVQGAKLSERPDSLLTASTASMRYTFSAFRLSAYLRASRTVFPSLPKILRPDWSRTESRAGWTRLWYVERYYALPPLLKSVTSSAAHRAADHLTLANSKPHGSGNQWTFDLVITVDNVMH